MRSQDGETCAQLAALFAGQSVSPVESSSVQFGLFDRQVAAAPPAACERDKRSRWLKLSLAGNNLHKQLDARVAFAKGKAIQLRASECVCVCVCVQLRGTHAAASRPTSQRKQPETSASAAKVAATQTVRLKQSQKWKGKFNVSRRRSRFVARRLKPLELN